MTSFLFRDQPGTSNQAAPKRSAFPDRRQGSLTRFTQPCSIVTINQLATRLRSLGLGASEANDQSQLLVAAGHNELTWIKASRPSLLACGLEPHVVALIEKSRWHLAGRPRTYIAFVKVDTVSEAVVLLSSLDQRAPGSITSRNSLLRLKEVIDQVSACRNFVCLLSSNFAKSPYALIELCTAVAAGCNIVPIAVRKVGAASFDFAAMRTLIMSGRMSSLLTASDWKMIESVGISKPAVAGALSAVLNASEAIQFDVGNKSQEAEAMESLYVRLGV